MGVDSRSITSSGAPIPTTVLPTSPPPPPPLFSYFNFPLRPFSIHLPSFDSTTTVFQVDGFGGTKAIVFSTTSWLGGKNEVLPFAYLVVGGICFFLGIVFLGLHIFRRRDLGDMKYWNWRS